MPLYRVFCTAENLQEFGPFDIKEAYPAFVIVDSSQATIDKIRKKYPAAFWREHTLRDEPGWGLARILWMKQNVPQLLRNENIYAGVGEYAYFLLTRLLQLSSFF